MLKQGSTSNKKQKDFLKDLFTHQEGDIEREKQAKHAEDRRSKIYRSATVIQGKLDKKYKDMKGASYRSIGDKSN